MLNARWLETFVTLCETGHFTRAAEQLHMTQPGVSQHLKKLEAQIGQPLISRDGKSFTPTPAGEAVLALGRERRAGERALHEALGADDPDVGKVTLACSGSLAMLVYPHFLGLMECAPRLMISLEATPQARIVDGVLSGDFDIGIVDHAPAHARLSSERLGADELTLVLPADAGRRVDFDDLQVRGFIAHPDGFGYAEELFSANFPEAFHGVEQLRLRSFINQIGQIPEPVARGLGYTILPRSGIDAYPGRALLTCAELQHPVRHELWLIQRRGKVLAARTRRVRDLLGGLLLPL